MALREELVANAVRFLHNEAVQGKPEDEKRVFMTNKGLTEAEIVEALHRAAGGSASSSAPVPAPPAPAPQHPPMTYDMYPPPYPPQQYVPPPIYYAPPNSNETPWWKVIVGLAGALGIGVAASNYYRQKLYFDERRNGTVAAYSGAEFASPQRAIEKAMSSLEPVRETSLAEPSNLNSLEELLKQQAKDHKDMMQRLLESNRQHTQSLQQLTQKVAQLTLSQTIKPQADLSDASLHVLQEALLDALQKKEDNLTVEATPLDDSAVEKIGACLKVISEESDTKDEAKKSLSMLNTILENLRRHPENEKYRKVNTTSNRFKERFSPKQRADEFFSSLGFEESGPNFVFPPGPISPTVHKAMTLISDMLKNLDHHWISAAENASATSLPAVVPSVMPWTSSVLQDRSKGTSTPPDSCVAEDAQTET